MNDILKLYCISIFCDKLGNNDNNDGTIILLLLYLAGRISRSKQKGLNKNYGIISDKSFHNVFEDMGFHFFPF
jgi:hypothetical protein